MGHPAGFGADLEGGFESGDCALLSEVEAEPVGGVVDLEVCCQLVAANYGEVFGDVEAHAAARRDEVSVSEEIHAI